MYDMTYILFALHKLAFHIGAQIGYCICSTQGDFNLFKVFWISKRRYVIELIVFFGIGDVINSGNSLLSRKSYFLLCIHRICYIEDLGNVACEYPWVILVTCHVEVDNCEPVVVHLDTIRNSSPLALEDGDLQIPSIVELYNLFYEAVVGILVPCRVKGFSANVVVLALALHVLLFGVKHPPIDIVPLPRRN